MPNQEVHFGPRAVGGAQPVYLVAEIGLNHNGSLDTAGRLIDAAAGSGWDCVKFQKRTPELCIPEARKSDPRDTPWGRMTYLEYRRRIEFGAVEYAAVDARCRERAIAWSASVWDLPSLDFLIRLDPPYIKIPSAKLAEPDLVEAAASSGRPVVLSTGMSTLAEVDAAVNILDRITGDYVLLHTTSAYPTPEAEVNLGLVRTLRERYGCLVGYSGHEDGLEPSVLAAALGACVIERHVTLDRTMWGSDHAASLEVGDMSRLRRRVDAVGVLLGDGVKRVMPGEVETRRRLRGC
jgi:N-acetylneuraminate synthase